MAYSGSTELSSAANPPRCVSAANIWGQRSTSVISSSKVRGQGLWMYATTDGSTELAGSNYFTDAYYIGMKEGDVLIATICTGTSAYVAMGIIGPVTTAGANFPSTNYLSSTR